jgi:hypothetical protein
MPHENGLFADQEGRSFAAKKEYPAIALTRTRARRSLQLIGGFVRTSPSPASGRTGRRYRGLIRHQ